MPARPVQGVDGEHVHQVGHRVEPDRFEQGERKIMLSRLRFGAVALAAAFGSLIAVGSPAAAADDHFWTRSCGSKYYAYADNYIAWTKKYSGGSCSGHAWVRVKVNGDWTKWYHASGKMTLNNDYGEIELSEHKGCADCKPYLLIP
ncbi:hypothetical protein ACFZBP_24335 [Streptomyces sp. NPDC008086]|uniref:hypothetical protein n=1 Tax=Streptomyces sp. NPDC008086 TaxID=3364807 RepID=UPI0036DFFAE0